MHHAKVPYCLCRGYLAPEFVDGGEISYKSDIYSLGATILKLSTGCSTTGNDYVRVRYLIMRFPLYTPVITLLIQHLCK